MVDHHPLTTPLGDSTAKMKDRNKAANTPSAVCGYCRFRSRVFRSHFFSRKKKTSTSSRSLLVLCARAQHSRARGDWPHLPTRAASTLLVLSFRRTPLCSSRPLLIEQVRITSTAAHGAGVPERNQTEDPKKKTRENSRTFEGFQAEAGRLCKD